MTEKNKAGLWDRTKEVATTYTGTFIVVMFLNQLLFFGFCLNPICLIAAMPHVLLITVVVGSLINKIGKWGERGLAKKALNIADNKLERFGDTLESASEGLNELAHEQRLGRIEEIKKNRKGAKEFGLTEEQLAAIITERKPTQSNQARADLKNGTSFEKLIDLDEPYFYLIVLVAFAVFVYVMYWPAT
jgi:hypothetical protein